MQPLVVSYLFPRNTSYQDASLYFGLHCKLLRYEHAPALRTVINLSAMHTMSISITNPVGTEASLDQRLF